MPALARFLGLAFASADLLLEVNGQRRVVFAVGAGGGISGDKLVGRVLSELVDPSDRAEIERLLDSLKPGERCGPLLVRVRAPDGGQRRAEFAAFALPELAPNVSCALAWCVEDHAVAPKVDQAQAQIDAKGFDKRVRELITVAASRGRDLSLALVEIKGLIEARRNLPPEQMTALLGQVRGLLASHGAEGAAADLSEERFAVVSESAGDLDGLVKALNDLVEPGAKLSVSGQTVPLQSGRDPLQQFRAVRAALDCFLKSGLPKDEATLRRSFTMILDETSRSAGRLSEILDQRRFDLYFQPVVDLETELATHHEVLVRFEKGVGPGALIKLAEDLALIERLDASVIELAVRKLREPGAHRLHLAVNVSGGTLLSDAFLERLLTSTHSDPSLRERLKLEITETAALHDLEAAQRRIRALHDAGFQTLIDDFGAGAASIDYLRALPVNGVKIDGRYVRGVDKDERAQAIIKHVTGLCGQLGHVTVAEMVEREEELATVKALGVTCGQGWLFGRPEADPRPAQRRPAARARRVGERETWS